jgi:hypothetical protein
LKPPNLEPPTPFGLGQRKVNDRTRIIMMCVALLVVGGGYLWLRSQKLVATGSLDPNDIVAVPDDQMPIQRIPSARVDGSRLEAVKDATLTDRLVREPEPYQHLLTEARKLTHGDLEALGMTPIDAAAVRADPAIHRGRPYFVRGILESIDVSFDPQFHEIRGVVKDLAGQRYAFSVLSEPEVGIGDVVKLEGYFFKLLAVETAPGEYDQDVIHLVGRRLLRSFFPLPPNEDLAKIPFYEARDADLAEQVEWPDDLIYQTLNWTRTLGKEKAAALEAETVDYAQLRKEPDRYRGKVVRVFGNFYLPLEWQRRFGPEGENPLGHNLFTEGLLKLPHDRLYRWIGFEGVPREHVSNSRLVALKGVFIKNVAWQNTRSDAISGPLLVVTGFEPFMLPDESSVKIIGYIVAGLTFICIALFMLGVFNDQRRAREFQKEYMRRKRRLFDHSQKVTSTSGTGSGDPPP